MIAERVFDAQAQAWFAALSGDRNPIHVDEIAVRRTLPGRLVVHGVHLLLWALAAVAGEAGDRPPIARLRVRFLRFTYVGDRVSVAITGRTPDEMRLRIAGGGVVRAEVRIGFGPVSAPAVTIASGEVHPIEVGPLDHRARSISHRSGAVALPSDRNALATGLPGAAAWIGAGRIDALAAATRLVGMIYPGLHSVLGGLDVRLAPERDDGTLAFEMGELRHGQIDAVVSGAGIVGTLDCRVPAPPVVQPSSDALRTMVAPGRYAGARALVIGGSRGVGETCAKLLALGGAEVVVTYRDGADDSAAVAEDIARAGGRCSVRRYDAAEPAEPQLGADVPTHAGWFATPVMARPDLPFPDDARAAECRAVLVSGFVALAIALHARRPGARLLYPSTDWIGAPPAATAEYFMAKAAAEVAARAVEATCPPIRILVPRLPAMATDQTARLGIAAAPVAETILPHLDRLILEPSGERTLR